MWEKKHRFVWELLRILAMPLVVILFFLLPGMIVAQSPESSFSRARSLDALLQDYAYRAFVRPRTGVPFVGTVPSNLTGIQIAAMRLRRGSLKSRGVRSFREFEIPTGVVERPYVKRLVLVYQNLGNWSAVYYPPPAGHAYLVPVLGLLAYNASNLSATNLPEVGIEATGSPIRIKFRSVRRGINAQCIHFDLNGGVSLNNATLGNTCLGFGQGHFSIVGELITPPPPPPPPAGALHPPPSRGASSGGKKGRSTSTTVWITVGSVAGGLTVMVLLVCLASFVGKWKVQKKMQQMDRASDEGEALQMSLVGGTKAPTAMWTRTPPALEHEYVP